MPFNGSGVYTIPNGTLATSGQTILVSQHNPFVSDVESALNQAFLRTGTAPMIANLNMNTFKIIGLANGTNPGDAVNLSQLSGSVPVAALQFYAGQTVPSGWLLCFGQAVSRTTYAALYAVVGGAFGNGDGSTTFNVPDMRGRAAAGADNMGGVAAGRLTTAVFTSGAVFSAVGGTEQVQLTGDQNGTHAHSVTDPGHSHIYNSPNFAVDTDKGGSASLWSIDQNTTPSTNSATTGISIQASGSGNPHNNVQPTMLLNWIIRTGV